VDPLLLKYPAGIEGAVSRELVWQKGNVFFITHEGAGVPQKIRGFPEYVHPLKMPTVKR
jgi:hypothetical protein